MVPDRRDQRDQNNKSRRCKATLVSCSPLWRCIWALCTCTFYRGNESCSWKKLTFSLTRLKEASHRLSVSLSSFEERWIKRRMTATYYSSLQCPCWKPFFRIVHVPFSGQIRRWTKIPPCIIPPSFLSRLKSPAHRWLSSSGPEIRVKKISPERWCKPVDSPQPGQSCHRTKSSLQQYSFGRL